MMQSSFIFVFIVLGQSPADALRLSVMGEWVNEAEEMPMDLSKFQNFAPSNGVWKVFNKYCHPGDYCLKIKYPSVDVESKQDCPLQESMQDKDFHCLYRQHGSSNSLQQFSASQYLSSMSDKGKWNCETNTWHLLGGESITVFDAQSVPTNFDNIITYGDSTAQQIYMGLTMVANNFTPGQWWHNRPSVEAFDVKQFHLEHICCAKCACGKKIENVVNDLKIAVQKGKNTIVIFRASLHTKQNAHEMASELDAALQGLEQIQQPITILWIPQHGSGNLKPKEYIKKGQSTENIRKYDADILASLKESNPKSSEKMYKLDFFEMFQAAENECDGAYGSPDGTHFSFNLMAHAGQAVLGFAQKL